MKQNKIERPLARDTEAVHPVLYLLGWMALGVGGIALVWYYGDYSAPLSTGSTGTDITSWLWLGGIVITVIVTLIALLKTRGR